MASFICCLSAAVCVLALCGCSGHSDSNVPPGEASAEYEFLGDVTKVVSVYDHSGTVVCESEVDAIAFRVSNVSGGSPFEPQNRALEPRPRLHYFCGAQ